MSMQDKTGEKMTLLADLISKAEAAEKAASGPVSTIGKHVNALVKFIGGLSDDDKRAIFDAGIKPNALMELERTTIPFTSLDPSTQDRSEGDKLATGLLALVEMGFLEGEDREQAETLVEKWTATAPKKATRSASTGESSSFGPLGFSVEAACKRCAFKASTSRDNLNSIRDQMKRHEISHGASKDSLGRTTPAHVEMTDGLNKVMHAPHVPHVGLSGWTIKRTGSVPSDTRAESTQDTTQDGEKEVAA